MFSSHSFIRRLAYVATAVTVITAAAETATAAGATAATSVRQSRHTGYVNPLAGHRWAIYRGGTDRLYPAFERASGFTKRMLAREALHPHTRWYTSYIPTSKVGQRMASDIRAEQHGNPNVLVWMATFRLWPHQEAGGMRPLRKADRIAYRQWVDSAARGIGSSRVALVVEPDLAVTRTNWNPAVRLRLTRYAVRRFSRLRHTTVYIDGSSEDWLHVSGDVKMLRAAGIRYAHGFALGATHHPTTAKEVGYGRQVSRALARAGFPNRHFIVDTSDNGHGYGWGDFYRRYPHGVYNDPPACKTMRERECVSLGIPPTTDVMSRRWHLSRSLRPALRYCDAFMWVGRPWLAENGHTFRLRKAVNAARTDPYLR